MAADAEGMAELMRGRGDLPLRQLRVRDVGPDENLHRGGSQHRSGVGHSGDCRFPPAPAGSGTVTVVTVICACAGSVTTWYETTPLVAAGQRLKTRLIQRIQPRRRAAFGGDSQVVGKIHAHGQHGPVVRRDRSHIVWRKRRGWQARMPWKNYRPRHPPPQPVRGERQAAERTGPARERRVFCSWVVSCYARVNWVGAGSPRPLLVTAFFLKAALGLAKRFLPGRFLDGRPLRKLTAGDRGKEGTG